MSARKTFKVAELIKIVNDRNAKSVSSPGTRDGWNSLLEEVLHSTGTYAGYGHYSKDGVPEGHLPGVQWNTETGYYTIGAEAVFPDDSRRYYYVHSKLQQD